MTPALDIVIRSSSILGLTLVLRAALIGRSAAIRHAILVCGMAGALLVVPASLLLPAWRVSLPARAAPRVLQAAPTVSGAGVTTVGEASPARRDATPRIPPLVLTWAGGLAAALTVLLAGLYRLTRIAARARPLNDRRWESAADAIAATFGLRRAVLLLETDDPFALATWGIRPARVLLPSRARDWSDERMRAVLRHELAHVARGA